MGPLATDSLILLRAAGLAFGLGVALVAFLRFRRRALSRGEVVLRWLFSGAVVVVSVWPSSVNLLAAMLALHDQAHGRLIVLLVVSSFALWSLLLRERQKVYALRTSFDAFARSMTIATRGDGALNTLEGAEILVAIPALNEAANIGAVLERLPAQVEGLAVRALVIDDGSSDGTADVVRQKGQAVVSLPTRRGQGAALRLAYDVAKKIRAKIVVTLDADGQHLPEEIPIVVGPVLRDEQDFVVGSRLLGTREKDSLIRLIGIHTNNLLIGLLSGRRVTDCSNGFKAIRVACLDRIVLTEDQFQAAESLIAAANAGLRIGEVPITVKRRLSGESKKGRTLSYGFGFVRTILRSWWR